MTHPTIERLLQDNMGLSIPSIGSATIDRTIRRRMVKLKCDTEEDYVARITLDDAELQELIENVVVPETWFFRDPEAFAALGKWVAEEWLPRHSGETLKILSVPCSTGEEPYSIAMALLTAGMRKGDFEITAMDISRANLSDAKACMYGRNSFRTSRSEFIEEYFTRNGPTYQITDAVRALVDFRQENLLHDNWVSEAGHFHVIFCRNLLIYFNADTQQKAMQHLDASLLPGGLLFVGSAEMFLARTMGYMSITHPMSFGYRKPVAGEAKARESTVTALVVPMTKSRPAPQPVVPALRPVAPMVTAQSKLPDQPAKVSVPDLQQELERAHRLADLGELAEAKSACESLVKSYGDSADCMYLLGLIADAEGDGIAAADFYRKALYVDPNHSDTLMQMAVAADNNGDTGLAARLRRRVLPTLNSDPSKPSITGRLKR